MIIVKRLPKTSGLLNKTREERYIINIKSLYCKTKPLKMFKSLNHFTFDPLWTPSGEADKNCEKCFGRGEIKKITVYANLKDSEKQVKLIFTCCTYCFFDNAMEECVKYSIRDS